MTAEGQGWIVGVPAGAVFYALAGAAVLVGILLRTLLGRATTGRRVLAALHTAEGGLVALLLAAMLGLSFLQIILRNLARTGFVWIDPLLRHLLLWIGFTGAALATRLDRHINIDALTRTLPPRAKRAVRIVTTGIAATICMMLAEATMRLVREEAAAGSIGFLHIPTWSLQIVMPLACWLMSYRFVGLVIGAVRRPETVAGPAGSEGGA